MKFRQAAGFLTKIAIASGMLFLVFRKVDLTGVLGCLKTAKAEMLGCTAVCFLVPIWVAGWRWKKLLRICDVHAPYISLVLAAHIGQFFALFLPGPLGDDTARVLYLSRLTGGRSGLAVSSVMMDRIVGLSSLLLMGAACIPFHWGLLSGGAETRLMAQGMLGAAAGLVVVVAGLLLMGPDRFSEWLQLVTDRLPKFVPASRVMALLNTIYERRSGLASVLLAAFLSQLALCSSFYFAGRAVAIDIPFLSWMAFVPIILAAGAIPVTIAGVGVRDYLMVLFLGILAGVDENQAVAASLIILGGSVFLALLGGVVFLFHRPVQQRVEAHPSAVLVPLESNLESKEA